MSTILGTVMEVPIDEVVLNPAERREIDPEHVRSLADSILKYGLISPISVYSPGCTPPYLLLAGAHRYSACKHLNMELISVRVYDHSLSSYEKRAIEVFENVHRKDLSPSESSQKVAELHQLMVDMHGPAVRSGGGGHSMLDTARMLGKTTASISQDVKIANAIEKFPELKLDLVTSKITALRMLHRLRAGLENKVLTRNLPASELLSSYVLGDFFLQALPAESYTIIECDPPYGIDLVSQRDTKYAGALSSEYVEQSASDYPDFIKRLAVRLYELAAPRCWLIFWFGPEWTSLVYDCLSRAGWYVCSVPPIWKKGNTLGQSLSPDSNLSNAYECFYYARKGNPKLAKFGRSNIFDFTPVSGRHRIHPTERPPALIKEILETFCMSPSDMNLLCPFAGSGNTLAVAHSLGMRSIGFDLSKEFYESFVGRYLHSNLTPNEVGEEAV